MKNLFLIIFAGLMFSCSPKRQTENQEARIWTDSSGRSLEIAAKIERVVPSGTLAQLILYSLVPEKVIGWAQPFSDEQKRVIPKEYWDKPVFGSFYGRGNMNFEAVIAAKPDIIIDLGQKMPNIAEDMNGLSAQISVPAVFIEATLETLPLAYKNLGEFLGAEEQTARCADYITKALEDAKTRREKIPAEKRLRVYYGEGKGALTANALGTIHVDIIEYSGGINAAVLNDAHPTAPNPISLEQIILWNPDVIILGQGAYKEDVLDNKAWSTIKAVGAGRVIELPLNPWPWAGRPHSINKLIGIKWLGNILYPDVFDYDIQKEAQEFYRLFYHAEYK